MTHTPEQLKKLAEFAAEYLGNPFIDEDTIFTNDAGGNVASAAYHMHLAQEKLEKEGFFTATHGKNAWVWKRGCTPYHWPHDARWVKNRENKFIAFWLAVMQAKGEK